MMFGRSCARRCRKPSDVMRPGQDSDDEIGKANDICPKDLRLGIRGAAVDGAHGPIAGYPGPDVAQPGWKRELPGDIAIEPAQKEDPAHDAEGLEADQRFLTDCVADLSSGRTQTRQGPEQRRTANEEHHDIGRVQKRWRRHQQPGLGHQ